MAASAKGHRRGQGTLPPYPEGDESVSQFLAGTCHLWWARASDAHARLQALLSEDEHTRFAGIQHQGDRNRFLASCGVMRLVLARYLGIPAAQVPITRVCSRCGRPHGRARLENSASVEMSLSHSGDRVVVAFARETPVGVDVEHIRENTPVGDLVPLTLAPPEVTALRAIDSDRQLRAFFVYWTRKEAILKAIGCGLSVSPQQVIVSSPDEFPRLTTYVDDPRLPGELSLFDLQPGREYAAALAVIGERPRVATFEASALLATWRG